MGTLTNLFDVSGKSCALREGLVAQAALVGPDVLVHRVRVHLHLLEGGELLFAPLAREHRDNVVNSPPVTTKARFVEKAHVAIFAAGIKEQA